MSLKIEGLSFAYQSSDRWTIENFNLQMGRGEIVHLQGPSGSGKTTLLKLIIKLIPPPSGMIFLDGEDITNIPVETLRKRIKLMLTPPAFFDTGIEENFKIAGIATHSPDLRALFHALNLPMSFLHKQALELSYGELQRLNLVRALLVRPQLLLLDEPTQGLDIRLIEDMFRLLMDLCQEKSLGLLITSHTGLPDFVRSSATFRKITLPSFRGI